MTTCLFSFLDKYILYPLKLASQNLLGMGPDSSMSSAKFRHSAPVTNVIRKALVILNYKLQTNYGWTIPTFVWIVQICDVFPLIFYHDINNSQCAKWPHIDLETVPGGRVWCRTQREEWYFKSVTVGLNCRQRRCFVYPYDCLYTIS